MLKVVRTALVYCLVFFFQAEDGIRDLVRSRGLGDVYKRQVVEPVLHFSALADNAHVVPLAGRFYRHVFTLNEVCLLYTSDAADERSSVDLGGRRIIKKKKRNDDRWRPHHTLTTRTAIIFYDRRVK